MAKNFSFKSIRYSIENTWIGVGALAERSVGAPAKNLVAVFQVKFARRRVKRLRPLRVSFDDQFRLFRLIDIQYGRRRNIVTESPKQSSKSFQVRSRWIAYYILYETDDSLIPLDRICRRWWPCRDRGRERGRRKCESVRACQKGNRRHCWQLNNDKT